MISHSRPAGFILVIMAALLSLVGWGFIYADWIDLIPARGWLRPATVGVIVLIGCVVLAMDGLAAITRRQYDDIGDDLFPKKTDVQLRDCLSAMQRPFWLCTRCRIVAPAHATMGACPKCDKGVDCYEVATDADAQMVRGLL